MSSACGAASATEIVGVGSLSLIEPVPLASPITAAELTPLRFSVKVSGEGSSSASSVVLTMTVFEVSPALNVSVAADSEV